MSDKKTTYSKIVIEIADYIFSNHDKKMSDILSYFVTRCRKNERTIERYVKKAKEYNDIRIDKQEKAKEEVLIAEAKESAKKAILTRNERLEILSDIINSKARKVGDEILIPSDGDRIRAIAEMNKMQGDYAPEKIENSVNFSDPFSIMRKLNGIN